MKKKKMNFEISISTEKFKQKPTDEQWGKMNYRKNTVDIDSLSDKIKEGYCFAQCFKTSSNVFGLREKTIANFDHTNTVWLDLDDVFVTIDEFYNKVSLKPSLLYSTPSNKTGVNNRFRAVYLFDEAIKNNNLYKSIVDSIIINIKKDIDGFILKDTSCRNASQQFGGNASNDVILYKNYNVFSFHDFNINNNILDECLNDNLHKRCYTGEGGKQYINASANHEINITDREFIKDFFKAKIYRKACEFIDKYRNKYPFYNSTPLPIVDEDTPLIELPDDYVELKRYWLISKEYKSNGDSVKVERVVKIKAGKRGDILYKNAKLRKIMTKGISFEHLLFQLFCELQFYIHNSDKGVTNKRLFNIAVNAYLSEDNIKLKKNKHKFIINPAYKEKYHPTKSETMKLIASVKRQKNDILLLNHYDIYLSVKDNLKHFHDLNIPMSLRKLYSFCREQGLSTKGSAKE